MNIPLFPDVVVNGETIPSAAIAAEAQNHNAPKDKPGIAWRKAAQALAIRALMLQEARTRGLEADPEELAPGRFETEDEALIRTLLDEALTIPQVMRQLEPDRSGVLSPGAIVRLASYVVVDVVRSNYAVAAIIMGRRRHIRRSGFIHVPLKVVSSLLELGQPLRPNL